MEDILPKMKKEMGLTAAEIEQAQELKKKGYPGNEPNSPYIDGDWVTAQDLLKEIREVYLDEGGQAGVEKLEQLMEMVAYPQPKNQVPRARYQPYVRAIFKEAQTGGGRSDQEWARELYRWIYESADRYPNAYTGEVVLGNYLIALSQCGRRAEGTRLLLQWRE
jgi:hypothetical protein